MRARIMEKLGITPSKPEAFRILAASLRELLEYAGDIESLSEWDAPVLNDLGLLNPSELKFLVEEIEKEDLPLRECQVRVQRVIPRDLRKKFAAYYTVDEGLKVMTSFLKDFIESNGGNLVLADPFLGSGLTLTSSIDVIGQERVRLVWGIEPLRLPALVAYASLVKSVRGRREKVRVTLGDAFKVARTLSSELRLEKANAILTNPPFTRWRELERSYREQLLNLADELGYSEYITRKEVSLQVLSIFICDLSLVEGGLLISVLPASTFYTIYGRGLKLLLRDRYRVHAIIGSSRASFSDGSGFKEVILVAEKSGKHGETAFVVINGNSSEIPRLLTEGPSFEMSALPRFLDMNWLALLGRDELRNAVMRILVEGMRKGTLLYWDEALGKSSIIRGVEIYGPDFFFLPNKQWKIIEERDCCIVISDGERELGIGREFLVKTLRKPSLYSSKIEAEVNSYMLSIPPVDFSSLPIELRAYVEWGISSGSGSPAIRAFGKRWYSHVHKQIATKDPFGHLFIPDKVDLRFRKRGVFANYTRERVSASKNFYIISGCEDASVKLLTGWFNSTIFISLLALLGRRISETWTRFLERDYLELPLINVKTGIEDEVRINLAKIVENLSPKDLPPLWEQIGEEYRYELDLSLARLMRIDNPEGSLEDLYDALEEFIQR